ncbi:hypothetical protein [Salmonirosea aquatica]|uniref:Uncharacterized protein n=1 Tax=Salmonirosea aquatica TaxID=2654236 RepID=A0A7C9F2S6_9BACT|nr:hypothetical protein [Cytophagaceae bacterium SJW1-29]
MESISSLFRVKNMNPPVEEAKIRRVVPAPADPDNPQLSILYFYGADDQGHDKIVRVWFYASKAMREQELASIRLKYPHLPII